MEHEINMRYRQLSHIMTPNYYEITTARISQDRINIHRYMRQQNVARVRNDIDGRS